MKRFRILWGWFVVLSLTLLAACTGFGPLPEDMATSDAQLLTDEAEMTPDTPAPEPTAKPPTPVPSETPSAELNIVDGTKDGVDCSSKEEVDEALPPYVQIRSAFFSGDQDKARIQITFEQGLELAKLVAESNVLYTVGVGVLDPLDEVSPDDPSANQYFTAGWLGKQQLFHAASKFTDGKWATTQNSEAITAKFDGPSILIEISRESLPLEGRLHLGVSRDNRICDFVGLSPEGSEITFQQSTVPDRLWIWGGG